MDTYAASAQALLQKTQNNGASASANVKTGSTDFMDLITKQLAAQRALAREQETSESAARRQDARALNTKHAETVKNRASDNRARSQDAAETQRQDREDRADAAKAKKISGDTDETAQASAATDTNAPQPPAPKDMPDAAQNSPDAPARDTAALTGARTVDVKSTEPEAGPDLNADAGPDIDASFDDDASLPADLRKLLAEIAAQLQTAKQDSPFAAKEAIAPSPQATGQEPTGNAQDAQTLALLSPAGKQKLLAALQSLMNGLPAAARPTIETLEKGILKTLDSDNLSADAANADTTADGTSALIVSGLTPRQLTDLMQKIKDGDDKDGTLDAGNFMINLVQLAPVEIKKDAAIFQPRGAIMPAKTPAAPDPAAKAGDKDVDSFRLTALLTGDGASPGAIANNAAPATGFDHILRMLEATHHGDGAGGADDGKAPGKTPDVAAGNSALPATPAATSGDLTESFTLDSIFPDGIGMASAASQATVTVGISSTAAMTSLTTSAPQAIYAHPATQEVAATLVKQAGGGDSTAMTLRLDPPELGKVSVKLEFTDKDKTVKAVISADKPETYMMLQRDSHVLQQALHDAGLDVGQNGLTFQLSQDGSAFGQQNRGQQNGSGQQSSGGTDNTISIETRMDWSVDTSGNWHYNVLA